MSDSSNSLSSRDLSCCKCPSANVENKAVLRCASATNGNTANCVGNTRIKIEVTSPDQTKTVISCYDESGPDCLRYPDHSCKICGRWFSVRSELVKHLLQHKLFRNKLVPSNKKQPCNGECDTDELVAGLSDSDSCDTDSEVDIPYYDSSNFKSIATISNATGFGGETSLCKYPLSDLQTAKSKFIEVSSDKCDNDSVGSWSAEDMEVMTICSTGGLKSDINFSKSGKSSSSHTKSGRSDSDHSLLIKAGSLLCKKTSHTDSQCQTSPNNLMFAAVAQEVPHSMKNCQNRSPRNSKSDILEADVSMEFTKIGDIENATGNDMNVTFKCSLCSYPFATTLSLNSHLFSHFACEFRAMFPNADHVVHRSVCSNCAEQIDVLLNMTSLTSGCDHDLDESDVMSNVMSNVCKLCKHDCKTMEDLNYHILGHVGEIKLLTTSTGKVSLTATGKVSSTATGQVSSAATGQVSSAHDDVCVFCKIRIAKQSIAHAGLSNGRVSKRILDNYISELVRNCGRKKDSSNQLRSYMPVKSLCRSTFKRKGVNMNSSKSFPFRIKRPVHCPSSSVASRTAFKLVRGYRKYIRQKTMACLKGRKSKYIVNTIANFR